MSITKRARNFGVGLAGLAAIAMGGCSGSSPTEPKPPGNGEPPQTKKVCQADARTGERISGGKIAYQGGLHDLDVHGCADVPGNVTQLTFPEYSINGKDYREKDTWMRHVDGQDNIYRIQENGGLFTQRLDACRVEGNIRPNGHPLRIEYTGNIKLEDLHEAISHIPLISDGRYGILSVERVDEPVARAGVIAVVPEVGFRSFRIRNGYEVIGGHASYAEGGDHKFVESLTHELAHLWCIGHTPGGIVDEGHNRSYPPDAVDADMFRAINRLPPGNRLPDIDP